MNTKSYYNYVIKSMKDNHLYIGYTSNLEQRMKEHAKGLVLSTKYRRPLILVYYEVSFNLDSALHREKYLKTTYGHRYLKNRIGEDPKGFPL
jgi:putative endonuclease